MTNYDYLFARKEMALDEWCRRQGYRDYEIHRYTNGYKTEADFIIMFKDTEETLTVEVHEQQLQRWNKYHEYSVGGESIYEFYNGYRNKCVSNPALPWVSKADIWLFFTYDDYYRDWVMLDGFWFKGYESKWQDVLSKPRIKHVWGPSQEVKNGNANRYTKSCYFVKPDWIKELRISK